MIEITGNLWDYQTPRTPVVITTNGTINSRNQCVMGRGTALQAKTKYPQLPLDLAKRLKSYGNKVFYFPDYNLITFPVKHNWYETADMNLIETSCQQLIEMLTNDYINLGDEFDKIYLPRPGCGNGHLSWVKVKPILEKYFNNDNYIIVNNI